MKHRTRMTLGFAVVVALSLSYLAAAAEPKVELLWPDGAPGRRHSRGGQAVVDDLPAAVGEGDRGSGRDLSRRRVWPSGRGPRGSPDRPVAELLWCGWLHRPVPPQRQRRGLQPSGPSAGRPAGHPHRPQPGQGMGVDPGRIGIIGFSAGGHLASSAATHFNESFGELKDQIDRASCRPDFAILAYPVISFTEPFTHTGSRRICSGPAPMCSSSRRCRVRSR